MSFKRKLKIEFPNCAIVTDNVMRKIIKYLWYNKNSGLKDFSLVFTDAPVGKEKVRRAEAIVQVEHNNKTWKLRVIMFIEKIQDTWKPVPPIAVHFLDDLPTDIIKDGEVWFEMSDKGNPIVTEVNSITIVDNFRSLLDV